jgi:hypothetical protein
LATKVFAYLRRQGLTNVPISAMKRERVRITLESYATQHHHTHARSPVEQTELNRFGGKGLRDTRSALKFEVFLVNWSMNP